MKAVLIRAYGGPDELRYEDFPDPTVGRGEVLIRVVASSVNPFDIKLRAGAMKDFVPLTFPSILGLDVSGIVQEIGPGVTTFGPGDRVFAHASHTYATLCSVNAADVAKIPDGMDTVDVAALPTVTTTGSQLADLALSLNSKGTVLVTGAIGNVGRSAVFQAKQHGAIVIAGVLKRQLEEARKTGADRVFALDDESIESLDPLDAIADTIGGPLVDNLLQRIREGGVFASVLGPPTSAGAYPRVRVEVMQVKPQPAALLKMAAAVRSGKLAIPLGQKFSLQDAAKAHAAVEGHSVGKILLLA